MNDNLKRYFAIQQALKSLRPVEPKGNVARHLNTFAMLVSGIIASGQTKLNHIARKVPDTAKPQSRIRRMERWLKNDRIDAQTFYLPYVHCLLAGLPEGPLVLVIDGSEIGRDCILLTINVLYQKRALPLCWLVVKGRKGHLAETLHIQVVEQAIEVVPPDRKIVFLGDGEFDGIDLLATLHKVGWFYVCRTAINVELSEDGHTFHPKDLLLCPGDEIELPDVGFTQAKYGPVLISILWDPKWKDPLALVSNFDIIDEALHWYKQRFRIETFFSDQKSRGFHIGHSHISDLSHMKRLVMASCLAYIWVVCLGAWVFRTGKVPLIHRRDRCDWSLFQLGMAWLDYCLNEDLPIPVRFTIAYQLPGKSVG
jgi:hypothetical protein